MGIERPQQLKILRGKTCCVQDVYLKECLSKICHKLLVLNLHFALITPHHHHQVIKLNDSVIQLVRVWQAHLPGCGFEFLSESLSHFS